MSGDFYAWLKEVRCTTVRRAAARFSISYTSAQKRLIRLVNRGVLEKRRVGKFDVYCLKDGTQLMPSLLKSLNTKAARRAEKVVKLLAAEGCMSTSALRGALKLGYSSLRHVLTLLMSYGHVVEVVVGRTAVWCRDRETAEELVAKLRGAAHRLASRRRYIRPSELLRMAQRDSETYALFSKFIPLSRFDGDRIYPTALAFADDILRSLYGESIRYAGNRHVYFVSPQPSQDFGIVIKDGADRIVAVSLSPDLAAALEDVKRRGASVKEIAIEAIQQLLERYK
jgi:predicted transcriptional regulator